MPNRMTANVAEHESQRSAPQGHQTLSIGRLVPHGRPILNIEGPATQARQLFSVWDIAPSDMPHDDGGLQ